MHFLISLKCIAANFRDKILKKKYLILIFVSLLVSVVVLLHQLKLGNFDLAKRFSSRSGYIAPNIEEINTYKDQNLPVAAVQSYTVSKPLGTVVYVPQYHKNPGTDSDDPKNDSAQIAQSEIYQIIKFLHNNLKVDFVMVEGELYGEVPISKIANTAKKLENRNVFFAQFQKLEKEFDKDNIDQPLQKDLCGKVYNELSKVDRDIILAGAPIRLKIEDSDNNMVLYGTENKSTLEESRVLVRNYIYLQDRLDQLQNSTRIGNFPTNSFDLKENTLDVLLKLFQRNPVLDEFETLKTKAISQGKLTLANMIAVSQDLFGKLSGDSSGSAQSVLPSADSASRLDNPYANINNVGEVKKMISDSEKQINQVVVDKRNKETSENFAKGLKAENKNIGILEFGAGHKEGLIKELNKRGVSVIMITSKEVAKRNNG